MPHNCASCQHWRPVTQHSLRAGLGIVGECRGGPPVADFKWPRSKATDYCSDHAERGLRVDAATAKPPTPEEIEAGRQRLRTLPEAEQQAHFFDAPAGEPQAPSARAGGPAAAVDAAAPQSTAPAAPAPGPDAGASTRAAGSRPGRRK